MARTTVDKVKELLGDNYNGSSSLKPYIDSATVVVDRVVACAVLRNKALTSSEKELVERWLSCHFYQVMDPGFAEKETENAQAVFHGKTAMYFDSTFYGQQAMKIDPSGCLEALGSGSGRKTAGLFWPGKPPSEQTDYEDRD